VSNKSAILVVKDMTQEHKSEYAIFAEEEALVAELSLLGIRYLSRQSSYQANQVRPPDILLADLVQQPHARVRAAVIAVLLSHPEYAGVVPAALKRLSPQERLILQSFYVAAMLLQREYADQLRPLTGEHWQWLPDLMSKELSIPTEGAPRERLKLLDRELRRRTQTTVNWIGTYEQVVQKLLHDWERRSQWNQ